MLFRSNLCNVDYRLNQRRILAYEKLDHFCFGVLCSVDHDGFLRERTSDDNYHAASDHRGYRIIGQNHAAGGDGLPGQHARRGSVRGIVTGRLLAVRVKEWRKAIPRHVYEVRPRKDHRGVDLISDVFPFGRLWYDTPDHAIGYAMHGSRSHDAVLSPSAITGKGVFSTYSHMLST